MAFDASKALGKPFCVAVVAARADLCTTRDRVPRRVCPFDSRILSHAVTRTFQEHRIKYGASMQPVALAAMQHMIVVSRIRNRDQTGGTVCQDETPGRFDGLARDHQQGVAQGAA